MNSPLEIPLAIGGTLFVLGVVGFMTRRSLILMVLSLELMAAGVLTNLIAFSAYHQNFRGHVFAILVLTVAACEAAIALAMIVSAYRRNPSLDSHAWNRLAEEPLPETPEELLPAEQEEEFPRLTPAGLDPLQRPEPWLHRANGQPANESTHGERGGASGGGRP